MTQLEYQLGSLDPAIACCDKAISLEPNNSKGYLRKGMALVQQGNLDLARQVLTTGQSLDPNNKSFGTWLGKCGQSNAAVPNKLLGNCDDTLSSLFEAHGQQGYPMIETVSMLCNPCHVELLLILSLRYLNSFAANQTSSSPRASLSIL